MISSQEVATLRGSQFQHVVLVMVMVMLSLFAPYPGNWPPAPRLSFVTSPS